MFVFKFKIYPFLVQLINRNINSSTQKLFIYLFLTLSELFPLWLISAVLNKAPV